MSRWRKKQCDLSGFSVFLLHSCARIRCCRHCALRARFTCSIAAARQRYMVLSRRGDSVRAGRACDSGWRNLGGSRRHRGVFVVLGIVLMAASLLFIPMKCSLPLAVVVAAMLCVQYGIQSLLKPMLQIETVHMMGQERLSGPQRWSLQVTMASNILGPVVGTAVYGCFGIDALYAKPRR